MSKKFNIKKHFSIRLGMVIALLLLLFLASSLKKEVSRREYVKQEIKKIEQETKKIEGKNKELKELIAYLKTNEFIEREARVKMGLAKENEHEIIFSNLPEPAVFNEQSQAKTQGSQVKSKGWFTYFFNP